MWLLMLQLTLCSALAYAPYDAASLRLKRATSCGSNEFKCKDDSCIFSGAVCDGVSDCADASDENQEACFNVLVPAVTDYISNVVFTNEATCPERKFLCSTGECIDEQLKCNGKHDCQDGSDERLPECPSIRPACSGDEFKCDSGSCVPSSSVCNKVRDCSDGSDEAPSVCGTSGNIPSRSCTYPPNPQNGKYRVLGCVSCTPDPGKPAEDRIALQYDCNPGYELSGETVLFCIGGKWNNDIPTCVERKCPSLSTDALQAVCTLKNQSQLTCDWPVSAGTVARVSCTTYYIPTGVESQRLTCGLDGKWSDTIMKCIPACGEDSSGHIPASSLSWQSKQGEFPWHVGIYKQLDKGYVQICGGSLISQSHVVTAAHCFWDGTRSVAYPTSLYKVSAGRYHRTYTTQDHYQQERAIETMEIPPGFRGQSTNLRQDIAVLTVSYPFKLSPLVKPVCVDWENKYYLSPGDIGKVAGWGITEKGEPSEDLRVSTFPVIEYSQCLRETKEAYVKYFGTDKICAGFRNGTSVCLGDSGGGLVFKHDVTRFGPPRHLYFLHGIVSSSGGDYAVGTCNLWDYVAFTKIESYLYMLERYREY